MRLEFKNMVCRHCVEALRCALADAGYPALAAGLGYAEVDIRATDIEGLRVIDSAVAKMGFERITDSQTRTAETIKLEILRHVNAAEPCALNLSQCIEHATCMDYRKASRIFSAIEGRTIEKYHIAARIEKVKELLSYNDMPLKEIAYRLGYSSVAFLSRQFKQETGMTPTDYITSRHDRRCLNEI